MYASCFHLENDEVACSQSCDLLAGEEEVVIYNRSNRDANRRPEHELKKLNIYNVNQTLEERMDLDVILFRPKIYDF